MSSLAGCAGRVARMVQVAPSLETVEVTVLPGQITVGKAHEAFRQEGTLEGEKQAAREQKQGIHLTAI
ncbi:MAG: hypothetical protein WCS94_19370 [Verrucomicrobiota bacterium]